jgi:hypothetical protein
MKLRIYLLLTIGLLAGLQQTFAQTSFTFSTNYSVGTFIPGKSSPYSITAFMNVDGKVDLVTANYDFNTLTVLTNDGSGNFASNNTYAVGSKPDSVAAADVNGDGHVDLICANSNDGTLTVLTNDGNGGFSSNATYNLDIPTMGIQEFTFSVVTADVNGDGYPDLVCCHYTGPPSNNPTGLIILTNNGSGGFAISSTPAVFGLGAPQSVAAVDVNGDGYVDLAVALNYQNDVELAVLTNNGSGNFTQSSFLQVSVNAGESVSVAAADVNGDGKSDLITANALGISVCSLTVFTNNGGGLISLNTNLSVVSQRPVFVAATDVNGDGKIDLAFANLSGSNLSVLTNNGSGGFILATNLPTGSSGFGPNWIAAADFNGDGKVDFASANRIRNTVSVFFNTSIFPPPMSTPSPVINPLGKGLKVSWPSASAGWSLQQNPDLTTTRWGPSGYSGYTISDDGTNKSLTIPSQPGNLFFRLLHP